MQPKINLTKTTVILRFIGSLVMAGALSVARTQSPSMKVDGKESNLVFLQKMDVDVRIHGTVATTTWTMTFKNSTGRILEGELDFPLAEGISVTRYALDIDGRLREAVPVEKEKGTMVFENVKRRGVDPGLLEKVEGNGFRTRIYPINPGGVRTVLLGYDEELSGGNSSRLRWRLPLAFSQPLEEFNLNVQILRGSVKPVIEENIDEGFQFSEWQNSWSASHQWKNFKGDRSLTVLIPKTPEDQEIIMQQSGNHYLYLLSAFPEAKKMEKQRPHRITLLWDVSLSGLTRDHEKELKLLDTYFHQIKNVEVTLVSFNHIVTGIRTFPVTAGNWKSLRDTLANIVYDGATQFGALRPEEYPGDEYLLFSDGRSNFGSDKMPTARKPLYAIVATAKADFPYLRDLTEQSGGELINLETSTITEANTQLSYQSLYFMGVRPDPALEESYPSQPTPVAQSITVAGICKKQDQEVTLLFGYGGKVMREEKVHLAYDRQKTGRIDLVRIWAQKKIAQLDRRYEDNKAEIQDLGRRYGIVTRNTSLIVLESIQDYVTYHIEPPAELREEYDRLIKAKGQVEVRQKTAAMGNAETYFDQLLEWWNVEHQVKLLPEAVVSAYPQNRIPATPQANVSQPQAPPTGSLPTHVQPPPPMPLEGRVAGVNISPGASDRIVIRGLATTSATHNYIASGYVNREVKEEELSIDRKKSAVEDPSSSGEFKSFEQEVQTAYINRLKKAPPADQYFVYLQERKEQLYTPLFYFNTARFFFKEGKKALGLQILSNIAELDVESYELYKMLGYELRTLGETAAACAAFKKVLDWRPFEPQSYRDYGLALWDAGRYQQALDTLYTALTKNYDAGVNTLYPGIEETLLPEINSLIALKGDKVNFSKIPRRLQKNMPVDIRVVLNWNMNDTDIDLWVTDPGGEKCYYSHRNTAMGGRISNDFTRGFGPEQFLLKKAQKGKYRIEVNYFGDTQTKLAGPTTVMVEVYTYYGTAMQTRKLIPLQMQTISERTVLIGEFDFK